MYLNDNELPVGFDRIFFIRLARLMFGLYYPLTFSFIFFFRVRTFIMFILKKKFCFMYIFSIWLPKMARLRRKYKHTHMHENEQPNALKNGS